MFEGLASSIKKILPKDQTTLYLILFLVLAFAIYFYSSSKTSLFDSMDTGMAGSPSGPVQGPSAGPSVAPSAPLPSAAAAGPGFALQPVANPSDLLPKDKNSQWAQLNPSGKGELANVNLLRAGYHIGIDTIGQSLRNANLQIRSEPPNPQLYVGPWNQTTIEPDFMRPPLEIGAGGSQ